MNKTWEYRRGDIYLADLSPFCGSEQGGVRPVIVIQNNTGNRHAPTLVVATVTAAAVVCLICRYIVANVWLKLIACGIASVLIPNVLFFVLFSRTRQFRMGVQFADQITKGRLHLVSRIFGTRSR